jgi:uncharacterized OB-fold protein
MMATGGEKFAPVPTPLTRVYWDACREHRLLIQRCPECGQHQFYPRIVCASCGGRGVEWVEASGRGAVESWTVVRTPVAEAYAGETPYVIALIRLDEGPVMMSQLVDCRPEGVSRGMHVQVEFREWSENITMPLFRPDGNGN